MVACVCPASRIFLRLAESRHLGLLVEASRTQNDLPIAISWHPDARPCHIEKPSALNIFSASQKERIEPQTWDALLVASPQFWQEEPSSKVVGSAGL